MNIISEEIEATQMGEVLAADNGAPGRGWLIP